MASYTDVTTRCFVSISEVLAAAETRNTSEELWAAVLVSKGCAPVLLKLVRTKNGYLLMPCDEYFTTDLNGWLARIGFKASELQVDVDHRKLTLVAPDGRYRTLGDSIRGWYILTRSEIRHFNPGN